MLHSASKNLLREVRIITNPPVALKEPFNYNRGDGNYSLVEAKTLKDLGRPEGLPEWKITGPRELLYAAGGRIQVRSTMAAAAALRVKQAQTNRRSKQMQEEMKKKELERLKIAGIPIHTLEASSEYTLDYYPS
jgi:hypothetical protein